MECTPRRARATAAWLLVAAIASAHGGSYTGGPGGGTPGYGGPGGGTTPGGRGGGATPGFKPKSSEPSALEWVVWWEMNRDRFLRIKDATRSSGPATADGDVVLGSDAAAPFSASREARALAAAAEPALMRGLRDPWWDVRASSVIALGKGADPGRADLSALIGVLLRDARPEVRESAALALGLHGGRDAVPALLALFRNDPEGRAFFENRDVPPRERAFAAMAVGLIGARDSEAVDAFALAELVRGAALPAPSVDVRIGPITALGLLRRDVAAPALLRIAADGAENEEVRAQAIIALGRLGARSATSFLADQGLSDAKTAVRRSSAIALGILAASDDDATARKLAAVAEKAPDRMTRNFAIIALAESGSDRGRVAAVGFARRGTGHDRTYGALACGISGFKRKDGAADLGAILLEEFRAVRADDERAAFALALGLVDYGPAAEALAAELRAAGSPKTKGFCCMALGLLRTPKDAATLALVRAQLQQTADLDLLRRAATGAGLCRDHDALADLDQLLRNNGRNLPVLDAAASALGLIGGRAAAATLSRIVVDGEGRCGDDARAFAAVGLGILSDKDALSALSRIREHSNFVAPPPALAEALLIY